MTNGIYIENALFLKESASQFRKKKRNQHLQLGGIQFHKNSSSKIDDRQYCGKCTIDYLLYLGLFQ